MVWLILIPLLVLCLWLVERMRQRGGVLDAHLGVLAMLAFGFYALPIIFRPLTRLDSFTEEAVESALLIHCGFFGCVVIGALLGRKPAGRIAPLKVPALDPLLERWRFPLALGALGLHLAYFFATDGTSYAAPDFAAFYRDPHGPMDALFAALSDLALALVALAAVGEWQARRRWRTALLVAGLLGCAVLALSLAQRLAILTPFLMGFMALIICGHGRSALRLLGVTFAVLAVVSPFAVTLREAQLGFSGKERVFAVAGQLSTDTDPVMTVLQSIIDRADLIQNSVVLQDYIDRSGFVGWPYYLSVLTQPVPRALLPDKPYPLSDTGTIDGEISVLVWNLTKSGTGGLSAFGGITGYRQGGWPVLVLDGLLDGLLFAVLARWLAGGGAIARVFYISVFALLAVKRAPPSLMESLSETLPLLPLLLGIKFVAALAFVRVNPRLKRHKAVGLPL